MRVPRLGEREVVIPAMRANVVAVCVALWSCSVAAQNRQKLASFESAVATSTFASGAFPATDALVAGTGYWCSSGSHAPGERVTWTGVVVVPQLMDGVTINWAYGPGEFRILTSADGGNFEEAVGWRTAARPEISYAETVLFDSPREVKTLAVVMRSPKSWGFFGINDLVAIVEPGPSILTSGSADAEELCLVADGEKVGVRGCLDAIASGSGTEIFNYSPDSQLVSAVSGLCISIATGGLSMQDCEGAVDAGDGRSTFVLMPPSRVQSKAGNCLSISAGGVSTVPCFADQGGGVTMEAVPGLDIAVVAPLEDVAALLRAAAARQANLLSQLKRSLRACQGLVTNSSPSHHVVGSMALSQRARSEVSNPAAEVSKRIDTAVQVDLAAVKTLIYESQALLASASAVV